MDFLKELDAFYIYIGVVGIILVLAYHFLKEPEAKQEAERPQITCDLTLQ
jgi:predicted heme/steroid binding protein